MSEREKAAEPVPLQPGQRVWVEVTFKSQSGNDTLIELYDTNADSHRMAWVDNSTIHPAPQPAKKGE